MLPALCLAGDFEEHVQPFLARHCLRCHGADVQKAELSLQGLTPKLNAEADRAKLERMAEVLGFREMPPEGEPQPTQVEVENVLAWIETSLATKGQRVLSVAEKLLLPGYGNYVDHRALFTEPKVRQAATPARLWRLSPHIFMQRANMLSRTPLLRPQRNQGGDGLHPAFAYLTPPHTFRDHAPLHAFEEATAELLFDVCWQIAGLQTTSRNPPPPLRAFLALESPTAADWQRVITFQYSIALHSRPSKEEMQALVGLAQNTQRDTGTAEALQSVLAAVLLKPEAVYRFELGQGEPDAFGRVQLTPYETMLAISYALTDRSPDAELQQAAREGRLNNREDVEREVRRLLETEEATNPRLLRFFQEYFEYPRVAEVFKDARQANAIFANERIEDADRLVLHILKSDHDVLKRLLTEDRLFVMGAGMPKREPPERRARAHFLPDFGFPRDWKWTAEQPLLPPAGKRSGLLTHPAWLMAFSDNEKNQAIQRGHWIRTKLLGGTVPEVPIGVDAQLPDEPHQTLRERMHVTRADYCWRCHQRMDPLGLPFEQFDDFGRYRDRELDQPVNTSGEIAAGIPELDGPVRDPFEMLQRLAGSPHVEQVFIRHVFRYLLGRNETLADAPTLIDAHRIYRQSEGSMKAVVISILTSDSFFYRQLPPEDRQATR